MERDRSSMTSRTETAIEAHRMLIVDDHELFADSLAYIIDQAADDFEVLGIASSGGQAIQMVTDLLPDLVLMDIRMAGIGGIEATRIIHSTWPQIKIVILTAFADDEYIMNAVRNGAKGYLLKHLHPGELIDSLRTVMRGATLFADNIIEKLVHVGDETEPFTRAIQSLSPREREVLSLVVEPLSNQQIAERLNLSKQSVRNYVSSIYTAFGISERFELIRRLRAMS